MEVGEGGKSKGKIEVGIRTHVLEKIHVCPEKVHVLIWYPVTAKLCVPSWRVMV
jgi:hypothetical protein